MKPRYFIIKMYYDHSGNIISGSEEIIDYVRDKELISDSEMNQVLRKAQNKGSLEDIIEESLKNSRHKSIRPTVPDMPIMKR